MMKHLFIIGLCALASLTTPAAANPPQKADGQTDGDKESRLLMHLLTMPKEELAHLRGIIERIEEMSDEEKQVLIEHSKKLRQMHPEKVREIRSAFNQIPEEARRSMRKRWLEMPPEKRREWRKRLSGMSQSERRKLLKENGLLPPPPRNEHKRPDPIEAPANK